MQLKINMYKTKYPFPVILFLLAYIQINAQSDHTLWYDKPAIYFEEALVLGNGKMGASIFGGVDADKIYLNDITLWSGEPVNADNNPEASKYIKPIRKALKNEDYKLADELQHKMQGAFSQSYAPLGTMHIEFDKNDKEYTDYYRELDISNAIATIKYQKDGVKYKREYFVSYPDRIMAIKLSADKKNAINCNISFDSQLRYHTETNDKTLEINGYAPYHVEPNYRGDIPNAILFDEKRGTGFSSLFKIENKDGYIGKSDSTITISQCNEAIIYVSIATSFNGFDKNPATEGLDNYKIAKTNLEKASIKGYESLKKSHLEDYQKLYNRVELNLGYEDVPNIPTDKRLLEYYEGKDDKNLEELYFNYGRYLLISSSRTESVPANLQGLWNPYIRPPWSSNYTLNINLEENYWLAEIANLPEMHRPLLTFIDNLSKTGAITAKTYFGTGGWAVCHNSDIWAISNPVGDFGEGDPNWANWAMGGIWLATHLWEHYNFTQDQEYLKNYAYSLIKGAVQFCLDWMVKNEKGHWITSPGTSPENLYITPDGYVGATLYGATSDLAMIRELLDNFLKASKVLAINNNFTKQVSVVLKNIHPYKIGAKGNLQEWHHDWQDYNPKHRHQSHLFGLYPGHHITPYETPELAEACKTTLETKGDNTTGWSKGWRINLWARLWDGNRAYKMYRELLNYVDPDKSNGKHRGGGTYPNLLDAHPPFQIDGNLGGAASVIEMLVQSTSDKIFLLPALPDAWKEGKIKGIRTRGGFEVALKWSNNKLYEATILANTNAKSTVFYNGTKKQLEIKKGQKIKIPYN